MATHLFRRHEVAEEKEVGRAVERGRRRALATFVGVGVVLALILLMTSVTAPPAVQAAFPVQNGKIAFTSNQHFGSHVQIYVMDADGSNQTRLTFAFGGDGASDWSPDGTKIAFASNRLDNQEDVWVMDADGSNPIRLTTQHGSFPAWSPDGSKIAFYSTRDGDAEIYVMDANGLNQTRRTFSVGDDAHPSWSPDGSKIAFSSRRDGNAEIYVMDADGSNQTRLTTTTDATEFLPDWSPDGAKIAFQSDRDGDFEIYVMNADGSNQTRRTFSTGDDEWAAWSPDGNKIAFHSDRDGDLEIYVMNANGSGQTQLTANSAFDCCPSWQPLFYNFSGFFPPVDNPPTLNIVKAGSGVPVKFSLSGDQGLNILAAGYPKSMKIDCMTSDSQDAIEETVTAGGSSLTYDPITDQYIYVWKTEKGWAGPCRQLIVRLNDGTDHTANFKLTK